MYGKKEKASGSVSIIGGSDGPTSVLPVGSKIAAYTCDDRLLVKPVKAAVTLMPTAPYEAPYEGAKEMLLVEDVDNKDFLTELFREMYEELPAPKKKK